MYIRVLVKMATFEFLARKKKHKCKMISSCVNNFNNFISALVYMLKNLFINNQATNSNSYLLYLFAFLVLFSFLHHYFHLLIFYLFKFQLAFVSHKQNLLNEV